MSNRAMKPTDAQGDLPKLAKHQELGKRTMDFILPNKDNPAIIMECSFLATTSSGQGDKAKVELGIRKLIRQYYPAAKFVGLVDGIGWFVRKNDLRRMVAAYDEVFTFHKDDIIRIKEYIENNL